MEFTQNNDKYLIRLERGEEIISTLKDFCKKQNIKAGFISGIGAVDSVTLGYFNPQIKSYNEETINEYMEITSLIGNVSTKNDEPYLHLHLNATAGDYNTIGGHLISGTISLTAEISLIAFDAKVSRKYNEELGINLLDF